MLAESPVKPAVERAGGNGGDNKSPADGKIEKTERSYRSSAERLDHTAFGRCALCGRCFQSSK